MAKLKNPLFSLGALGRLARDLTFARRRGVDIVEKTPIPEDAKSLAQLSWRHMYLKAIALWHALSAEEKQEWESLARPKHMTGYAWFISQALKPNPGLYLPLQGGTMSGDIDMAKHRLLQLPVPVDAQEPIRLQEYFDFIWPYLYHEGARVYKSVYQTILVSAPTAIAFDLERYDTDTIHDIVAFNSRLTCKTAGKYLICGNVHWAPFADGQRHLWIRLNGSIIIGSFFEKPSADIIHHQFITTVYALAVNNYVELVVEHNSAGSKNILVSAQYSPEFMMQRIGS